MVRLALLDNKGKAVAFRRSRLSQEPPQRVVFGKPHPMISADIEDFAMIDGQAKLCIDLAQVFKIEAPGTYTLVVTDHREVADRKEFARQELTVWSLNWRLKYGTEPECVPSKVPAREQYLFPPLTAEVMNMIPSRDKVEKSGVAKMFDGYVRVRPRAILDAFGVTMERYEGVVQLARASNGQQERELLVARLYPIDLPEDQRAVARQLPILGYAVVPDGTRLRDDPAWNVKGPVLDEHGQLYVLLQKGEGAEAEPFVVLFDLWTGQAAIMPEVRSFGCLQNEGRCIVETFADVDPMKTKGLWSGINGPGPADAKELAARVVKARRVWSSFHGRWPGLPDEWRELVEGPGRIVAPATPAK